MEKKKRKAKSKYKSAESRARQLAGLSGVRIGDHVHGCEHIEKVNGKGLFASVPEDVRKQVIEHFCKGHTCRYIGEKFNLSRQTVDDIKNYYLEEDGQFRQALFQHNLKNKLQTVVDGALDRIQETLSEMSPKDAAVVLGVSLDKYIALEKGKTPDQLHQHLHVHQHTNSYISDEITNAIKPKQ